MGGAIGEGAFELSFQQILASQLDAKAQLTTGTGTDAGMFQNIQSSLFSSDRTYTVSLDLDFETLNGQVSVSLGAGQFGTFASADSGAITIAGLDLAAFVDAASVVPLLVSLSDRTGRGSTVRVDNLEIVDDLNALIFSDDFMPGTNDYFDPAWQFDLSGGGSVLLNALDTTNAAPEAATLTLLSAGFAGLGVVAWRRRFTATVLSRAGN